MNRSSVALLLSLAAPAVSAQVVTEMTPQLIDQAIAQGVEQRPAPYALRTASLWVEFDTPFLRVSERAAKSAAQDVVPDRSIATKDLLAAELRVKAAPEPLSEKIPSIKELLLLDAGGASVSPSSKKPYVEYAQSRSRKKIPIRGMEAVFPLAALQPGSRFRVVTSDGREQLLAPDPGWFKTPR